MVLLLLGGLSLADSCCGSIAYEDIIRRIRERRWVKEGEWGVWLGMMGEKPRVF